MTTTSLVQPYYTVQAGDTWVSIAQQLYGISSGASQLEAALGDPTLTPGTALVGLPADLTYPTYAAAARRITRKSRRHLGLDRSRRKYGANTLASQLEAALGDPPLFAGEHLINLPAALITADEDLSRRDARLHGVLLR